MSNDVAPSGKSSAIFDELKLLCADKDNALVMGAFQRRTVVQFNIGDKTWVINGQPEEGVAISEGPSNDSAACTLTTKDEIFWKLYSGAMSPQTALFSGKVKIKGDMDLLRVVSPLLKHSAENAKAKQLREEEASSSNNAASLRWKAISSHVFEPKTPDKWTPDSLRDSCWKCNDSFSFFNRRHHCRHCGDVFCQSCSNRIFKGNRVCVDCFESLARNTPRQAGRVTATPAPTPTTTETTATSRTSENHSASGQSNEDVEKLERILDPLPLLPPIDPVARADDNHVRLQEYTVGRIALLERKIRLMERALAKPAVGGSLVQSILVFLKVGPRWLAFAVVVMYLSIKCGFDSRVVLAALAMLRLLYCSSPLLRRRTYIYYNAFIVFCGYRITRRMVKYMSEEAAAEAWEKTHRRHAVQLYHFAKELSGFWAKVGQYISSRADIMPMAYIEELKKLQDELPATSYNIVAPIVESELGARLEDLFEYFDPEPLASASIGQVHVAILKDSKKKVVVKVQHDKVEQIMNDDMYNFAKILSWVAYSEPKFDFRKVLDDWWAEAHKELDFVHEASNMRLVSKAMAEREIKVVVPEVVSGMVTRRVLVMEYIDGFKITDETELEKHNIDRHALLKTITEAYACQIYILGAFNADPHPGNVMVTFVDGKATPVLLDYGLTCHLDRNTRVSFARMVYSAWTMDFAGLLESFRDMGLLLNREDPSTDMRNIRFLLRDTQPVDESRKQFKEFRKKQAERRKTLPAELRNPIDAWPGSLMFYIRVTSLLRGLCSTLSVRLNYMGTLSSYAKAALVYSTAPRSEWAKSVVYRTPSPTPLQDKINGLLEKLYSDKEILGMQVCVYMKEQKVADTCAGVLGRCDPRPVRPDSLFNVFSVTKGITATAVATLADKGMFSYDDRISQYWPEFGCEGKDKFTIAQGLSHQTGLQHAIPSDITIKKMCDFNAMAAHIAGSKPLSKTSYHYLTFAWLVGGLVEKVCGRHVQDVIHQDIAARLGLADEMYVGIPIDIDQSRLAILANEFYGGEGERVVDEDALRERMEASLPQDEETKHLLKLIQEKAYLLDCGVYNTMNVRTACIPSANGHCSARALARMYAMICCGGSIGEHSFFSKETARSIGEVQVTQEEQGMSNPSTSYGLGYVLYPIQDGNGKTRYGVGHGGVGGSLGFCDPESGVSIGLTLNRLTNEKVATREMVDMIMLETGMGTITWAHT